MMMSYVYNDGVIMLYNHQHKTNTHLMAGEIQRASRQFNSRGNVQVTLKKDQITAAGSM